MNRKYGLEGNVSEVMSRGCYFPFEQLYLLVFSARELLLHVAICNCHFERESSIPRKCMRVGWLHSRFALPMSCSGISRSGQCQNHEAERDETRRKRQLHDFCTAY